MLILAGGSLNLLYENPGLIIWTVITFMVVLAVLWLFAWKPIIKALDERNARVEDDLTKSRSLREEAEALIKEYDERLNNAKQEAVAIIDEGRRDAEVVKADLLTKAQTEVSDLKERATKEIEMAKTQALSELESKVVDTAISVLSGILAKDVNNEDHKKLVLRELQELKQEA